MAAHSDPGIAMVCEHMGLHAESHTADDVRLGFDAWDDFYAYYETALDGHADGSRLLDRLRRARDPHSIMPVNDNVELRRFVDAPGLLRRHINEETFGSFRDETPEAKETFDAATTPQLSQAVAEYIRLDKSGSDYVSMILVVGPALAFLRYDRDALRTISQTHDILESGIRIQATQALDAGASPEFIRDIPFTYEVAKEYGHGGYKPQDIAIIERAGVPVEYARSLVACHLGGVGSQAQKLIRVYEMGVPAEYLMTVNNAMVVGDLDLIDRLPFDAVLAAFTEGIPAEYLVA
jgi:hypothetical protein